MRKILNRPAKGFSLIEALMGALILGFGLIAIAKFQSTLISNSDTSKQRTEAVRLAQEKMEQMRDFQQLTAAADVEAYADIVTGSDSPTLASNTTYSRSWTVNDSVNAGYKTVLMSVTWTDRNNVNQRVDLHSVIAKIDPRSAGGLTIAPEGSPVKNPKDRSLNVPVPAKSIGSTGTSAFTPPGSSASYFVFNDASGYITSKCTGTYTTEAAHASATCTSVTGYVVTGYISFSTGSNPSASNPTSSRLDLNLSISQDSVVTSPECYDDSSVAATYTDKVTYTCVVYPLDHDGNASTAMRWSGTSSISLVGQTIGTTGSAYKICRYTYDYDKDKKISNAEHPGPNPPSITGLTSNPVRYTDVTESLENQNFLVIVGNKTCPSDSTTPTSSTPNYNTALHQP